MREAGRNLKMKHQQLLDHLAAKHLVQTLDEDLARVIWWAMVGEKHSKTISRLDATLPPLLARWNSVLQADAAQVAPLYRHKAWLALATLLHRYGLADSHITAQAVTAIGELNREVALSDTFCRRSEEFAESLRKAPVPLTRKPTLPDSTTFYRAHDVITIHLDGKYYAAYVHHLTRINESPIIEFYAHAFDEVPTLEQIQQCPAQGLLYDNGTRYKSLYSVSGIKFQPDPANQITLVAACVLNPPDSRHLSTPDWHHTVLNIFSIQDTIRQMFNHPGLQ